MCHSMMGLTRCYKTAVFYILYCVMARVLKGTWLYMIRIALVLYVHKFGRQGASNIRDDAGNVKNSVLPHAQIWGLATIF